MINRQLFFPVLFFILLFAAITYLFGQDCKDKIAKRNNTIYSDVNSYSYFNINNVSTIIYNDGKADFLPSGSSGFEYPKGSGKKVFYQTGILWGAKVNRQIRVGGSTYRTGLQAGRILPDGSADEPSSESSRIYRVRTDYKVGDLSFEAAQENKSIQNIFDRYEKDWKEWPAEWGAPFEDVDGDGIYNWEIDVPGVPGSDQTLWFVANDLDADKTKNLYGSLPLGIELQVTVWGYKDLVPIGNVMFKKYKVINRSSTEFDDMYLSIWSDPDLGDAGDDFVGCDTTLNLGYVYNGVEYDEVYGYNVPAAGIQLLQGPVVDGNESDVALYEGRKIPGKRNLPMTAFNHFI